MADRATERGSLLGAGLKQAFQSFFRAVPKFVSDADVIFPNEVFELRFLGVHDHRSAQEVLHERRFIDAWQLLHEHLVKVGERFLLAALAAVIGFLPAAAVTSALWAATHTQYPLSLQVTVFAVGVLLSWVAQRARTLWAPWGAHMIMDVVLDSLVG